MSASDAFRVALAIISSVGGAAIIILGLSSWLGKVWANRILEQDRAKYARDLEETRQKYAETLTHLNSELEAANRKLQAELDKTIHVYRIQFEKEFQALVGIWKTVSELRSQIAGLRPSMSLSLPDESRRQEELNKRFGSFQKALWALQHTIHGQGPFYGEEVYGEVDRLLMIAKRENLEMQLNTPEPFSHPWYAAGEKNKAEFIAQADVVSKVMRTRISQLTVYGTRG